MRMSRNASLSVRPVVAGSDSYLEKDVATGLNVRRDEI